MYHSRALVRRVYVGQCKMICTESFQYMFCILTRQQIFQNSDGEGIKQAIIISSGLHGPIVRIRSANNESKGCGNNFEGKNRMKIFSNLTVSTKFLLSRNLCKPAEKSKCPLISKQQSEQKYE